MVPGRLFDDVQAHLVPYDRNIQIPLIYKPVICEEGFLQTYQVKFSFVSVHFNEVDQICMFQLLKKVRLIFLDFMKVYIIFLEILEN